MKELSLKQNMLWNSLGSIFGLGCQWLITILVVRLSSGYDAAGLYSLAVSVYGIFAPIAQYRMYTYQVSDVNNENATSEYIAFRIITSTMALAICMAYSAITCSPSSLLVIFLYGIYRTLTLIIDVLHGCDQQNKRLDYVGKSLAAQGFLSLIAFSISFYISSSLELALVSISLAVAIVGLFYDYPRTKSFDTLKPQISLSKTCHLLTRCLPIVIAGIAISASASIPRQYLSIAMGAAALGIYSSVAAPVAIIQMGASYVYNPLLGYLSEYYASANRKMFSLLLLKTSLGIICVGICCAIAVAIMGHPLLVLMFGESISTYTYLLQPLILLAILTGCMWFLNDLLIALRNFKGALTGSIVSLVVSVATMAPCLNLWDINGITIACIFATTASIVSAVFFLLLQLKRRWTQQDSSTNEEY